MESQNIPIQAIPFQNIDWSSIPKTEHLGESGVAPRLKFWGKPFSLKDYVSEL